MIRCDCFKPSSLDGKEERYPAVLVKPEGTDGDQFYRCGSTCTNVSCSFSLSVEHAKLGQPPLCHDNLFCSIGTSKMGKMKGKRFYSCRNKEKEGCFFVQWIDTMEEVKVSETGSKSIDVLEKMLADLSLTSSLPDKGQKLRERLDTLKAQDKPNLLPSEHLDKSLDLISNRIKKLSIKSEIKSSAIDLKIVSSLNLELGKKSQLLERDDALDVPGLGSELYKHQMAGVRWLASREKDSNLSIKGGILADDMGLGKTIQMIALMLVNPMDEGLPGTLIVCPLAVLDQWKCEIEKHAFERNWKILKFHGSKRPMDDKTIASYDIVLTTYATVSSEAKKESNFSQMEWQRLILDEGHTIKNKKSFVHKSCTAIKSSRRWFLTATPLQNNLDDLHSAIAFLHFSPFDNEEYWKKLFSSASDITGMRKETMKLILQPILLHRRKSDLEGGKNIILLPPKRVRIELLKFDNDEIKELYETIRRDCRSNLCIPRGRFQSSSFTAYLAKLLQLRQLCNHPSLLSNAIRLQGKCEKCVSAAFVGSPPSKCDECTKTSIDKKCTAIKGREKSSAKISYLLQQLQVIRENHPKDKSIIFSQWTSMLDIIEHHLKKAGIRFTRFDGKMSSDERNRNLEQFRKDDIPVLLISLKSGGVGLNLCEANHVFSMDVWWNPSVEEQAFDRCYRIGQTKPVYIHRLVIENSIEEKILQLQDKKTKLAKDALSRDRVWSKKSEKLSYKELEQLLE